MTGPRATLLIPAWNEGSVIAATLSGLLRTATAGEFHVIVIANGCSDDTATAALCAAPRAVVIETPQPGKARALNLGYAHALPDRPVICLDADLSVTATALRALLAPIETGQAKAACGRMIAQTDGASRAVRAFHAAWALNPYFAQGKFGGLFALSPVAARTIFPLPPVIADDEYIRRSLDPAEIAFVPGCSFTARAPRDLATLLRVRRRALRGSRALSHLPAPGGGAAVAALRMLRRAAPRPRLWPALAVYLAVMAQVRLALALEPRTAAPRWERDATNRTAAPRPD